MSDKTPLTLEEALRQKSFDRWDFYSAVTGHDWWKSDKRMGDIHPFEFSTKNRDKIHELVNRLRAHYERTRKPGDQQKEYYCRCFDEIDQAYKTGTLKDQRRAIEELLASISAD